MLIATACTGVVAGSYVSAELLYLYYRDENRAMVDVLSNTVAALLSSPFSMSFGMLPTVGFYGSHGFLVIPGAMMAIAGSIAYYRHGKTAALLIVLAGFVLWSHNNYLGYHALMSV